MLDIFGREINRGDIIVYGTKNRHGNVTFSNTKLGVVSRIAPARQIKVKKVINTPVLSNTIIGGWATGKTGGSPNLKSYNTIVVDTAEKVVFYPLAVSDVYLSSPINTGIARHKNGRPKDRKILLTTECLKIDYGMLSDDWKKCYDTFIKEFKIV